MGAPMASRLIPAAWFAWSDGRLMEDASIAGMRRLMRKTSLREPGETSRARFVRLREVIEVGIKRRKGQACPST
jgi:hypothetical protein